MLTKEKKRYDSGRLYKYYKRSRRGGKQQARRVGNTAYNRLRRNSNIFRRRFDSAEEKGQAEYRLRRLLRTLQRLLPQARF